jgi:hypothetical protein
MMQTTTKSIPTTAATATYEQQQKKMFQFDRKFLQNSNL